MWPVCACVASLGAKLTMAAPGRSQSTTAMAPVSTHRSLLLPLLLLASLHLALSVHAAATQDGVPEPDGGQPVVEVGSRSFLSRAEDYYYDILDSEYLAYVLPALAITGLSLLFPNIVTVNTGGRRRRDTDAAEGKTELLLEHLANVYAAAAESDECLQRVACELGATAAVLKPHHRHLVLKMVGAAAPSKYSNLFTKFKGGVEAEKCEKLGCVLLDQ